MKSHGVIGDDRVRWVDVVAALDERPVAPRPESRTERRVTSTPQTFV
jgi:hypothetical protein